MHSIRAKINAVMIAAILTCVLVLGGIGILSISRESDRASVEKMNMISEEMQLRLNAYLDSLMQSVSMGIRMANDSLDGLDLSLFSFSRTPEQQERLDTVLTAHSDEVEHAFSSIAHSTNGIVTYYYCINADLGSSEHGFFWSRQNEEDFVRQPFLNSAELDINDTEHTAWYYTPLKTGGPVWVGPYKAHFLGDVMVLSYVAPIYRYGFLIGVLGMDILMDTIVDQFRSTRVYDTGFLFLMDMDGVILYHPTIEAGTRLSSLDSTVNAELLERSGSGDQMIRYTLNGTEKQLAFSTLRNKTKLGVTVPVSEITESQQKVTLLLLLLTIGLVAVFSLVTLLVVNALTRPLLKLASASKRLADGDYNVELDYNGKDEVGTLTQSFCQMRDHLKLYIKDLNSRAYTDAMTSVKNKGAYDIFVSRLNNEFFGEARETEPEFAVVMFDCNNLKHINDEYGHDHGDLYLKAACALICRVFAHSPVFRLGGDEFCTILQQDDYEHRDELLREFDRQAKQESEATSKAWKKINIARGMAEFRPGEDRSVEEVAARADQKMYEDKRNRTAGHAG